MGSFYPLAIVNNAAVNIVSSFGNIPRSGIVGLCSNSVFSFFFFLFEMESHSVT